MRRFLGSAELAVLTYSDGRPVMRGDVCLWRHTKPLPFVGPAGFIIEIPAFDPTGLSDKDLKGIRCRGVTDLASIPLPGRGLLPPNGGYIEPALAHDDGYVSKGWGGQFTRSQVDRMFLEMMEAAGVPWWRRSVIWSAVRVGGGRGWGS